ncbi:AcrR family transcriptional regulator [Streptomyces phaeochromogenes]|jgi:AcrR family transcriptional regulator|uniref:TetR/AcrR family transcriptional regulator n=1 Tax=Streptomyces phaeochromogenes TaxID=1923 RepID=UPI0027940108|nr:TetR/AcrR family transcriptional regulator [Streptomyces phaeochromogenes]MDQ0952911.1 AcrR family transcriptional regulator [Streptomyces phaeochromogenes]
MPARPMDPRTRRSRSALETALRELIAERDLSQISVSDITKRAGVNRSTFYEHYTDVHDLAAAACTTVFDELVAASPAAVPPATPDGGPPDNPLPDLFAHVAEHAPLYRALLGDDGSARVINHLLQRMTVTAHIRRNPAQDTGPYEADGAVLADGAVQRSPLAADPVAPGSTPHDPAAGFVAGAVLGSVVDWLRHGCPGTPEEMGAALWPLLIGVAAAAGWETEQPGSPAAG